MAKNPSPAVIRASADSTRALERLAKATCAITDFDRTLLRLFDEETEGRVARALSELYVALGVHPPGRDSYQDPYSLWTETYRRMLAELPATAASRIQRRVSIALAGYEYQAAGSASLYPGVTETLAWFRSKAIPCGIVSTNSYGAVVRALEATNVHGFFASIRGRTEETPIEELKPNPGPLLGTVEQLGGKVEAAFFVGDSVDDAASADAAGVVAIGVLTGKRSADELIAAGAVLVIPEFSSLRSFKIGG
jgi:phosphoglycolate phosphatase-like HAD superfamily hydrolase